MQLVVGRIGRAHGVRGDVAVAVRTDDPERRFAPGTCVRTDPDERGPLTIASVRWHSGRLLVAFVGVGDRTAAEALQGTVLLVDSADLPPLDDADDFYDHQLVGLAARTVNGEPVGPVTDVVHGPAGELLAIDHDGREVLVPFVKAMVPAVDIAAGVVVIDPPDGLLEL